MNQIEKTAKYSLSSVDTIPKDTAAKCIASLFAGLHSQDRGGLNKAVLAGYVEAVADCPEWAVAEATRLYRIGVYGNGKFVPQAGELARAARKLVEQKEEQKRHEQEIAQEREAIRQQILELQRERDFHANKTPESKARVAETLKRFKAGLASSEPVPASVGQIERCAARFATQGRQATEALLAREQEND